jgi:hypothetical protein
MLSQIELKSNEERCVTRVVEAANVNVVRPRTSDYYRAIVLAFVLCGVFTLTGLLVPPSLSHDAGWGMQEWRTLAAGGPINTIISADPKDISRDQARLVTWWSPGQYVIPGIFTLLGVRLGAALTITAAVSLLFCLLGWIYVAKHFALSPRTAILVVLLIATFRYSTLPFGIYNGGEILLQGITPWLILTGARVPVMGALRAAGLVFFVIWIAFFAKLTGVMVASAALIAGSVEALIRLRRLTTGMVAGAFGAILALGSLYVVWFSRGSTPASGAGWSFRSSDVFFALAAPWGAAISWGDMLMALLRRSTLGDPIEGQLSATFLWLLLPPVVVFVTVLVKGWKQRTGDENLARLLVITATFYVVCALAMSAIFLHGGDVSLEERHLRSAGMLILLCVLVVAGRLPRKSVSLLAVGALCGVTTLFGCFAFAHRAWSTKYGEIDHYSRTVQASIDRSAIEFVRTAFAREGRDALFVLPSPDAACALLPAARILSNHIEFDSEATIAARTFHGKVRRLYVIMPTHIAESTKGILTLKEFTDYPVDLWERHIFDKTTVFVQGASDVVALGHS